MLSRLRAALERLLEPPVAETFADGADNADEQAAEAAKSLGLVGVPTFHP